MSEIVAWIAPDPDAKSIRTELLSEEMLCVIAYALAIKSVYRAEKIEQDTP